MNVGTTTATATHQGLIARRPATAGASATLLMVRCPRRTRGRFASWFEVCRARLKGGRRLQDLPGVRPRRRLLVVDERLDGQADEQGILVRVVVRQLDAHRQP